MPTSPSYDELLQRVKALEQEAVKRKHAEDALRESEQRYRQLVEHAPIGIYEVDWQTGKFLSVNDVMCEFLEYSREELMSLSPVELATEESQIHFIERRQKSLAGEKIPDTAEFELITSTGKRIWANINNRLIYHEGVPVRAKVVAYDITERKHAEEALIESEKRYRQLVEYAPTGIYEIDVNTGRFISINDVMCDYMGYSKEELLSMNAMDMLTEEAQKKFIERQTRTRTGQRISDTTELELITKSGDRIWASLNTRLIYHDGKPVSAQVVAHNITDRKRVEEELRESEEKYRLLATNVTDNIWIFDLITFRFSYVSPSVVNITGFTDEEATGFQLHDTLIPSSLELATKTLEEELANDHKADPSRSRTLELEQYHKDGSTIWTEVSLSFIRDQEGKPVSILGVTRDISERKKLQAQLQQAHKMEAVGTLAGGVAHDFNNIIQIITGYAQLLMRENETNSPSYNKLSNIQDACRRAKELVQQLLLFSRKMETAKKPIDVNREIEQAGKVLERTIPKMVDIKLKLQEGLWSVNADPVQIEQIMLNLGKNAADAMPDGGKLLITTGNKTLDEKQVQNIPGAEPGQYVVLTVSDTGHGMKKEIVEKIFEPFFTNKEIGQGTGLGLASVYGIVKSHHGYILCNSKVNQGTDFQIYLPAIEHAAAIESSPPAEPAPQGGVETILLVDDEEQIRHVAAQMLIEFGYTVLTASNGEEALEIYTPKKDVIDLIILDINMPGMGGIQCLRELKNIDPLIKVVIASGYTAEGRVRDALEAGGSAYVGKPYIIRELLSKVRDVLDEA